MNHSEVPDPFRWLMLFGVWLLYFCFGLVAQSLAPLVPQIVTELNLSLSSMGRILGAWQFIYLLAALPLGLAVDRYGLKFCLALSALVISASALCRGLAGNGSELWFAVALFGVGGPLVSIGAPKVIAQLFGSSERGMAMGVYMTGPALGGIASLALTNSVLMPLLDDEWREVLFVYAGVAIVAGCVWFVLSSLHERQIAKDSATKKPASAASELIPGERLKVFISLLTEPLVLLVLIISIAIFTFSHGLGNWLPALLQDKGMSAAQAGYWASLPTIVGVAASLTIPRLAVSGRRVTILITLCAVAAISVLGLMSVEGPFLIAGLVLQGIARSCMMTIAILILIESPTVSTTSVGISAGLFFTFAEIGGVAGPTGMGFLAQTAGGFAAALWGMFAVCMLLLVLAFCLRRFTHQ